MRNSLRRKIAAGVAGFGLALAGCFTEAGNAEDENLVQANFSINYSENPQPLPKQTAAGSIHDTVAIQQFYLLVKEAEYHAVDSLTMRTLETHLWNENSSGFWADFTGTDSSAVLPLQNVTAWDATSMQLECRIPRSVILKPDTIAFASFHDRNYIKGLWTLGGTRVNFLFAIPPASEMRLIYSQQALESWYHHGAYSCEFTFFATKWLHGIPLDEAVFSKDRQGREIAVFDPNHNPDHYQVMVSAFYHSFNTGNVRVSQ